MIESVITKLGDFTQKERANVVATAVAWAARANAPKRTVELLSGKALSEPLKLVQP